MKSYNILFLCTHNSARSIIGEALALFFLIDIEKRRPIRILKEQYEFIKFIEYLIENKFIDIKRRNKDNQLHKILTVEDADIILSFDGDELSFTASDDLKSSIEVDANQLVSVAGKTDHGFFITHKDRPDFLLTVVNVPFSELLSTGKSVKLSYNKYNISVYTQKYFDKYSWRKV